jgi:hypothetical protein
VTTVILKLVITHTISRVLLVYSCWSVIFTCCIFVQCGTKLSLIDFNSEVEQYVVKLFVYVG